MVDNRPVRCLPIPADKHPTASNPSNLGRWQELIRSASHLAGLIRIEPVRMVPRDGHFCSPSQVFALALSAPNDAKQIVSSRDSEALYSFGLFKPS
jgi:hypothetical protein